MLILILGDFKFIFHVYIEGKARKGYVVQQSSGREQNHPVF